MIPPPAGFRHLVVFLSEAKRSHHLALGPQGRCSPSEHGRLRRLRQVVGRPSANQQVVG
jgi:hypothetical protein